MVMTQERFLGLCEKSGQLVTADRNKDLSNISGDLKTFGESPEAALKQTQTIPSASKRPGCVKKINQLLADMERKIETVELAKLEASQKPPETANTPRIPAPRFPSATNIS